MAGKKYAEALKQIDKNRSYSAEEAVALAKNTNIAKFDASVEVSFNLNVDPRHADQQIRGAMVLPHGTGRTQKVLVITKGAKEQEAKDAGADFVGGKEMLDEIKGGWYDAGDHVKFNMPMAYTASVLAWGLYQYPDGIESSGEMQNYVNNLEFVMDYFVDEYLQGRTPNPCIACNRYVKWEALLKRSMDIGADYIATGHYAKIEYSDKYKQYVLKK